jgi:hypothetical protein
MFVLMQDVGYILGLRLDGPAVTRMIDTENWKEMVHQFTGRQPPDPEEGVKEKKTSSVNSHWLQQHFDRCPPNAEACSCVDVAHGRKLPTSRHF